MKVDIGSNLNSMNISEMCKPQYCYNGKENRGHIELIYYTVNKIEWLHHGTWYCIGRRKIIALWPGL